MTVTSEMLVSEVELADLLGVSTRRVRQLAEAGTLERVKPGRYALGPALRALLDHASGEGISGELQRERTRKVRSDADMAELEYAKARKLVASIDEFERVQTARAALIRINVMNVAQRAALQLLGETREEVFKEKLRAELILALKAAADAEVDAEETEQDIDQ